MLNINISIEKICRIIKQTAYFFIFCSLFLIYSTGHAADIVMIKKGIAARKQIYKSAHLKIKYDTYIYAESEARSRAFAPKGPRVELSEPRHSVMNYEMYIDANRMKVERMPQDSKESKKYFIAAYDGKNEKTLNALREDGSRLGTIRVVPVLSTGEGTLWPVMCCYWHLDRNENLKFPLDKAEVVDEDAVINGVECTVLKYDFNTVTRKLWISPEMDYSIVKYTYSIDSQLHSQLDVSYENRKTEQDKNMWVPVSWDSVFIDPALNKPHRMNSCTAQYEDEINSGFSDETFDLKFPAGTVVNDTTSGNKYYHVKDGESNREVTKEEVVSAKHADVFTTDTGEAVSKSLNNNRIKNADNNISWLWLMAGNAVILAVVVYFIFMRRSKQ